MTWHVDLQAHSLALLAVAQQVAPTESEAPLSNALVAKFQAPRDTLYRHLDHWLQSRLHAGPAHLWAMHLLVAVTGTLLLAWLVSASCRWLASYLQRRERQLPAMLLRIAAPALRTTVLLLGLSDAVQDAWPAVKGPARWLSGLLFVFAVIVAIRGFSALTRAVVETLLKPRMQQLEDAIEPGGTTYGASSRGLVPLLQWLAGLLLWFAGVILVMDHFGQNLSAVVATLSVTSLAIGLASQQALSNIIAGLVLALDHPFRVGDRVRLPGQDTGEVLEIGIRSTHIRLSDGSVLIVPNADVVSVRLINQSTETSVRAEVKLVVPALLDLDALTKYLELAASKIDPPALSKPAPPRVHLLSIGERIELALILWLPRTADVPKTEEALRRAALRQVQELMAQLPQPPMRSDRPASGGPVPAAMPAPAPAPVPPAVTNSLAARAPTDSAVVNVRSDGGRPPHARKRR